jgi:hypothetical protein
MGNTREEPSPTKLARLGHFPPASQAGRLAGPVYVFSLVSPVPDIDSLDGRTDPASAELIQLHQSGAGSRLSQAIALQHRASHAVPNQRQCKKLYSCRIMYVSDLKILYKSGYRILSFEKQINEIQIMFWTSQTSSNIQTRTCVKMLLANIQSGKKLKNLKVLSWRGGGDYNYPGRIKKFSDLSFRGPCKKPT